MLPVALMFACSTDHPPDGSSVDAGTSPRGGCCPQIQQPGGPKDGTDGETGSKDDTADPQKPDGPDTDPPDTDGPDTDEPEENCVPATGVFLNEVSAANEGLLLDEDGEAVDWIELYNANAVAVELEGWSLTDDQDEPRKWVFPPTRLGPGEFLLIHASGKDSPTRVETWDTRIDLGDEWRYLEVTSEPDADWSLPGYDDSDWPTGPSGFGREDGDDATEISSDTAYLRTSFTLTQDELDALTALSLHMDYDDAFVAYLNGVEVARAHIGVPGVPPAWDAFAIDNHEALLYQDKEPELFDLTQARSLLVEGDNTLAIEVHNASSSSRDLSVAPLLSLGFADVRPGRDSAVLDLEPWHMHTNFALRASGERVRLYDAAGCEVDDLDPDRMYADQSFGRQPDGGLTVGYFMEPTPGAPNTTESRPGFAATPLFTPPPGHYPGGVEVTLVAPYGAEVRVAWGGEEPNEDDPLYTGPLQTGSDGEAVVIRARAYQSGLWPSRIATATYLLREPGTLPIVSVVTEPANLWDEETGIYVYGTDYEPESPHHGANFWEDWEKPVHVQQWEPDGSLGFSVDAGVSIHGGYSRAHEQRSLLIKLRSGYGDDAIEYDVFPGLGITSFTRLLLRAAGTDWLGCDNSGCSKGAHLRDAIMHRLTAGQDIDVMAYRPAEVYLNGEYWGIYDMRERMDDDYIYAHHGYEDIDLLEFSGRPIKGDDEQYDEMLEWMRTHDLSDPANYAYLRTLIDVDELASYLAFEIYYDNRDWPQNNIKFWRPRTPGGRWRWLLYDTDWGLGRWGRDPDFDTLSFAMEPTRSGNELFRLMMGSEPFKQAFLNRYADYINTLLSPEVARATLHELADGIATEMPRHLDRWGSWSDGTVSWSIPSGHWEEEIDWIDEWLGERPEHARAHAVNWFGLSGTWELSLQTDPPGAGTFRLTAVEVDEPFTGIYFEGVPMTITAVPAPGYSFLGWSDPDLPAGATVTLDPGDDLSLVAYFQ